MPTVINRSTVLTDAEVQAAVRAIDRQGREDFAPQHDGVGRDWQLTFERPAYIKIVIVDEDTDVPDALGYHSYTGRPVGVVLAKTAMEHNENPSVTLSHEYLEIMLDPFCDRLGSGYWLESCDAVQAQTYGIDGVEVSNFVTKYWWTPSSPGPWDHLRKLTRPQQVASGGYQVRYDLQGERVVYGDKPPQHGWRGLSRKDHYGS